MSKITLHLPTNGDRHLKIIFQMYHIIDGMLFNTKFDRGVIVFYKNCHSSLIVFKDSTLTKAFNKSITR